MLYYDDTYEQREKKCCVRTGGRGKHKSNYGGAFCKAKYEIRRRRKARAGKNSFPPTPFLFVRPSVSVLRAKRAIIRSFAQKMFEHQSKNTAKHSNSSGVIFYTNGLWSENATPNLIHKRCCLFTDMNVKIFILHHGVGSFR